MSEVSFFRFLVFYSSSFREPRNPRRAPSNETDHVKRRYHEGGVGSCAGGVPSSAPAGSPLLSHVSLW